MIRSTEEISAALYDQAVRLWGQDDAEQQREALQRTAEQLADMDRYELPPDVEPRFF